jgi:alginate O-acetyltransferase complex protein AlgI
MEIISLTFVFLALVSVFIFYLLDHKYRTGYLTLISCCFVTGIHFYLLIYILLYSAVNYFIGKKITVSRYRKLVFRIGVIVNIAQLAVCKYSAFSLVPVLQKINGNLNGFKFSEIIVPLGISYFTLQGIGYLINIYMGWEKPEKKFSYFLLYIVFYPKFLSGPIERSNHFLPQINKVRPFNEQQVADGLKIALIGFFKKVVIANPLGLVVNSVYSDLNSFSGINLWAVILIQPLYLYFDFSGYTDIAIGLAKTYGIELLPNFRRPYLSENMTIFWKRFHMSLSFWFNDYLFKQISFRYRRWGNYGSSFAVLVTFTLFGIWHGAGWNFMALGLIQAFAVIYEFLTKRQRIKIFSKMSDLSRVWTSRIFTYLFFGFSLVFFYSPDINSVFSYFSKLSSLDININFGVSLKLLLLALMGATGFMLNDIFKEDYKSNYEKIELYWLNNRFLRVVGYYLIIILIVSQLSMKVSFIYQMF